MKESHNEIPEEVRKIKLGIDLTQRQKLIAGKKKTLLLEKHLNSNK